MSMGDRGWRDSTENYCDGYVLKISGSTATAIQGNSYKQPAAIYGLSIACNQAGASGSVDLVDSSATGDADTTVWSVLISSGTGIYPSYVFEFPRGLTFNNGIVITATTVSASISLLYKSRYS